MSIYKRKTGQDYFNSGSACAGFNRRISGDSYLDCFRYENERTNAALHQGWDLAEDLIKKGEIFYKNNDFHGIDCEGSAFNYGGTVVCNTCRLDHIDQPWWWIRVYKDGNAWCCVGEGFEDLQASDNYAFGDTRDEAIKNYGALWEDNL